MSWLRSRPQLRLIKPIVSEKSDLWSHKFQTIVQTLVRLKTFPDHAIRAHFGESLIIKGSN